MTIMTRTWTALLAILALSACATEANYEKILKSWVGSRESELIAKWGPPGSVYEADGTKYLTYQDASTGYIPGTAPTYQTSCIGTICTSNPVGGSPGYAYNRNCKTTFMIVGGLISNWRWEGNACRA